MKNKEARYRNFTRIPADEQQKVLEACLEEFANHGYVQASTNAIVTRAGIPKGTLFFYFGSKKALFLYLLDHAIQQYTDFSLQNQEDLPSELFDRLLYLGQVRMQFVIQHPLLYQLFYNAFINTPAEIQADINDQMAGYAAASQQMLTGGLDTSHLKPGLDLNEVLGMVFCLMEGIFSQYTPAFKSMTPDQSLAVVEKLNTQVRTYFRMIQQGIYW